MILAKGLAIGLEFMLGSGILRTLVVRKLQENILLRELLLCGLF